jgi:hypothetical protein
MNAALKFSSYDDVLTAPAHLVAELVNGVLHTKPRPGPRHANCATAATGVLRPRYGRGGPGDPSLSLKFCQGKTSDPGGWIILAEPELHLKSRSHAPQSNNADVLVPDIAGWRRERMARLPDTAYFELAPDWVCEVLSPSTLRFDRTVKMSLYADSGVSTVWLIEPIAKTLEIYQLQPSGKWLLLNTFAGETVVHPAPFDAMPFDLSDLWAE